MAYRFEPPYSQACALKLGPEAGMESSEQPSFLSVLGESKVFVKVGTHVYEMEGCSTGRAPAELRA